MTKPLTVVKCDAHGQEVFRWEGAELERGPDWLLLEARFNIDEHYVGGLRLRRGDRLLERYYADRWYNIFEVFDGQSDLFKGWYCNVSRPAHLGQQEIRFDDLALDLIVYPDGRQEELDQDEFEELEISAELRQGALEGWDELRQRFIDLYEKDPR